MVANFFVRSATPATPSTDSLLESQALQESISTPFDTSLWVGWRLRFLVATVVLGALGLAVVAHWLCTWPTIHATWRATEQGQIVLLSSADSALRDSLGQVLTSVSTAGIDVLEPDAIALQKSMRWLVDDAERSRYGALRESLVRAMSQPELTLSFSNDTSVTLQPQASGLGGLGAMFWVLALLGFGLFVLGIMVSVARPSTINALYSLIALAQSGNLLFLAIESAADLGAPLSFIEWDLHARTSFDLITAAALVHGTSLYPRRLAVTHWLVAEAWVLVLALIALLGLQQLGSSWSLTQLATTVLALTSIGLLSWSIRAEPHPTAVAIRRFGVMALSTWVLLSVAIASSHRLPAMQHSIASIGSVTWYVFFASLVLLVPFLSRSQQFIREFSMLAAASTVAVSLDLLFAAAFSLGPFASLTLALFLALAVYTSVRQWILSQMHGSSKLSTERMFERLYRVAREVEQYPERTADLLSQLLRELFEPLEIIWTDVGLGQTALHADGSTLIVPVPDVGHLPDQDPPRLGALQLRFAHRGRRIFTREDARLTERVVEQLRRAVAFDKAVEQGRTEERARIAQDLHDDIGARLLTLMYTAQTPEMEDYLRHTLLDLKTLTRGLAAPSHRLSHAAAEWKTDLTQRLAAAHCDLQWSFSFDRDILLSTVQWSALTRILRELVSNTIAHALASRVEIDFNLGLERLVLSVTDNGRGGNPAEWSHGLGLGGVRKRVKQLGGTVEWAECQPQGICCRVVVEGMTERH